jgi:hypothetical protein
MAQAPAPSLPIERALPGPGLAAQIAILLFHGGTAPDDMIEYFTGSPWCHSGMIWRIDAIARVMLLEAVDKFGVRSTRLSRTVNGFQGVSPPYPGRLLVARHSQLPFPLLNDRATAMMDYALDHLGFPYANQEIVEIAERIGAHLADLVLPGVVSSSTSFICSQYVAECLRAAGVTFAFNKEGFIAPADIADNPAVEAVCGLTHD